MNRYDVIYGPAGVSIDYHFCRELTPDGGCFGTNPDHGFSWEEAKREVVQHYALRLKMWELMEEKEYFGKGVQDE